MRALTPGGIHTCTEKPLSNSWSKTPCGSTFTATRPPGAVPIGKPSTGLAPRSSARIVSVNADSAVSSGYGPEIHSSPTNGEPAGSPL